MALIKCPECGKEVSDKAIACPNCGYPIAEMGKFESGIEEVCNIDTETSNETEIIEETEIQEEKEIPQNDSLPPDYPYTICPKCGSYNSTGVFTCRNCWHRYSGDEYKVIYPWEEETTSLLHSSNKKPDPIKVESNQEIRPAQQKEFHGIYRYVFGKKIEIYCPRCHSENCSYYNEQKIIPGKTKTRYTANLKPLRPFTLVNKKEKVVRKEKIVTEQKIMCNNCGYIFK